MNLRAHIFFSGRVQGVCFRSYAQEWASSLNLTGWVRNLVDGRVEVLVEGDKERIENFVSILENDHPYARVENVEINWGEYQAEFDSFRITW